MLPLCCATPNLSLSLMFQTYFEIPSSLRDVPGEPPGQPDVGVRVDEDLHVQHVQDVLVVKGEDAFEDEDVGAVHRDRLLVPAVGHKVVDGHLHFLALLQAVQRFLQLEM